MKIRMILPGLMMIFFADGSYAKGVSIDPGLWEMSSTMTMTMMPQPQTTTETECVEETELSPESFNKDKDNPCDVSNVSVNGNSASWSISCPGQAGMAMQGQWAFTSKGDSISGTGSMKAVVAGQEMGFDMTWNGKRVGDCP